MCVYLSVLYVCVCVCVGVCVCVCVCVYAYAVVSDAMILYFLSAPCLTFTVRVGICVRQSAVLRIPDAVDASVSKRTLRP